VSSARAVGPLAARIMARAATLPRRRTKFHLQTFMLPTFPGGAVTKRRRGNLKLVNDAPRKRPAEI
jgi:hypothetical protein